jgi:hypothetical protein
VLRESSLLVFPRAATTSDRYKRRQDDSDISHEVRLS